ncbi:hypothetical protein M0R45_006245 [Rubus argutus]|uniref:Uncharacterized protein n=1 Tax=Rubus argutus TaxID=59490 RepID=A0AAW1YQ22_RUBAR
MAAGFGERRAGVAGLRKKCRCDDDVELESGGLVVIKGEHGLDWWCWCGDAQGEINWEALWFLIDACVELMAGDCARVHGSLVILEHYGDAAWASGQLHKVMSRETRKKKKKERKGGRRKLGTVELDLEIG